ncbi:hypothetical protein M0R45_025695 [Rubus argutus]|uniref:Uncharacterized protein n=1 Tax=Rubus argutus TaxID=59490 RepID=A0AAW1WUR7_RUBAR
MSAAMRWYGRRGIATMFEGMGGIRKEEAATLTSSRFPEIIRRDSTSFTAAGEKDKKQGREIHTGATGSLKKDKFLYLCFWENQRSFITHRIQCIRLSHVLAAKGTSTSDVNSPPQLKQAAIRCGPDTAVPHEVSSCVVGSKFLFSGGVLHKKPKDGWSAYPVEEISEFETDPTAEPIPTFKPSTLPMFNYNKNISKPPPGSVYPSVFEVDGKLYCLGYCFSGGDYGDSEPYVPVASFEVFDPKEEEGQWLPLDLPPCDPHIADGYMPGINFTHAVAGSNILLWAMKFPGVFRFDVTHPENGWTELNGYVRERIPHLGDYGGAKILILKLQQQQQQNSDHGYVMFSCDSRMSSPEDIEVFLMSHECDSLTSMEPLLLPHLPRCVWPYNFEASGCSLFHIEGQKVGIVFNGAQHDCDGLDVEKVTVVVITFEYEMITTYLNYDIKYKFISARCLEYSPNQRWNPEVPRTCGSDLIGVYVL